MHLRQLHFIDEQLKDCLLTAYFTNLFFSRFVIKDKQTTSFRRKFIASHMGKMRGHICLANIAMQDMNYLRFCGTISAAKIRRAYDDGRPCQ
jgi:hypothetical protein